VWRTLAAAPPACRRGRGVCAAVVGQAAARARRRDPRGPPDKVLRPYLHHRPAADRAHHCAAPPQCPSSSLCAGMPCPPSGPSWRWPAAPVRPHGTRSCLFQSMGRISVCVKDRAARHLPAGRRLFGAQPWMATSLGVCLAALAAAARLRCAARRCATAHASAAKLMPGLTA